MLFLVDNGEVIDDNAVSAEVDEHVDDLLESPIPESIESLFKMARLEFKDQIMNNTFALFGFKHQYKSLYFMKTDKN